MDTHVHVLAACNRGDAGKLAQRIAVTLLARLGLATRFDRARIRPVNDQSHLTHAFHYILNQYEHHKVRNDGTHEGSCLPDLLGLRVGAEPLVELAQQMLPRLDFNELYGLLGPKGSFKEVPLRWNLLADAAAAAFGLPDLAGRTSTVVAARNAACTYVNGRMSAVRAAELLGTTTRTLFRARKQSVNPNAVRAVQRQLVLRSAIANRLES